ncbi:TPA: FaeA/PapI family transcriptional regulator [Salmonella enterica subsp. enterica serovar Kottbus]
MGINIIKLMRNDKYIILLSLLELHTNKESRLSTRELGVLANMSVFQAMYYLRKLQREGRVVMEGGGGRGRVAYWRRVN